MKIMKKMLKSNFGNQEKLVPTRKTTGMFGLKFGMQGLINCQTRRFKWPFKK